MARLARSLAAQKAFVGDAAHQLRTPLARLKAAAEYALRSDDPARWREALERMQGSVESSTRLVNQLLALARAEGARVDGLTVAPVDLVVVAGEVTAEFVPAALRKDIDLGFEAAVDTAPALADAALAREMLANLVDNAVRYTPPGGHVTVAVILRDARVRVTVADDGPGIPAAEREAVFDRFHRGAEAPPGGSGLGLAIVRALAELMGASVRLEDAGPAPGTVMVVEFPAAPG